MQDENTRKYNPYQIFSENAIEAFEQGATASLLANRNPNLGYLLLAERSLFYVQILYRMLLMRRQHELEPLYEDIFDGVSVAQSLGAEEPYTTEQFRTDLNQLCQWKLVSFRIEKERIRGYRDNRKKKFRYRLGAEAISFLIWLEDSLQDDLDDRNQDARNQLEDFTTNLNELIRLVRRFNPERGSEESARRILYRLFKLEDITTDINSNLGEFNARLLGFITQTYNHNELKQIIAELETYLQDFMRKLDRLRQEVLPSLEQLTKDTTQTKINRAFDIMEEARRKAPHFLRGTRQNSAHRHIPQQLARFHNPDGILDRLCGRIHESAFLVVRKMYAYLRELERKNNRIEDIRDRIDDLVSLEEDQVPHKFFQQLLAPVQMRSDPQHWNAHEKAEPPKPRRPHEKEAPPPRTYLPKKEKSEAPAKSMEMQMLEVLDGWITQNILHGNQGGLVSGGKFESHEDFEKVIVLAKSGYLNKGARLGRIGYHLEASPNDVEVRLEDRSLSFKDMEVVKNHDE